MNPPHTPAPFHPLSEGERARVSSRPGGYETVPTGSNCPPCASLYVPPDRERFSSLLRCSPVGRYSPGDDDKVYSVP